MKTSAPAADPSEPVSPPSPHSSCRDYGQLVGLSPASLHTKIGSLTNFTTIRVVRLGEGRTAVFVTSSKDKTWLVKRNLVDLILKNGLGNNFFFKSHEDKSLRVYSTRKQLCKIIYL